MTQNENHQQEIWSLWDPFVPAERDCPLIFDESALRPIHERLNMAGTLQPGELRPGLPEDRDIEIGIYPECQEILVGGFCVGIVSRQD